MERKHMSEELTEEKLNELDAIAKKHSATPYRMPESTLLWHCGIFVDLQDRPIWCESEETNRHKYMSSAKEKSRLYKTPAHQTTFSVTRDLHLLHCNGAGFLEFAMKYCNDHRALENHLAKWSQYREFDGLIALNGSQTEVFIIDPLNSICVKSKTEL